MSKNCKEVDQLKSGNEAGDVLKVAVDHSSMSESTSDGEDPRLGVLTPQPDKSGDLPSALDHLKSPNKVIESCGFELVDGTTISSQVPTMQASESGVITIHLPHAVTVEVTLAEDIRVIGKTFQMLSMKSGKQLGVIHPHGRIFCNEEEVHAFFSEHPIFRRSKGFTQVDHWPSTHLSTVGQEPEFKSDRRRSSTAATYRVLLRPDEVVFNSSLMSESVLLGARKRPIKVPDFSFPEVGLDSFSKMIHESGEEPSAEKLLACQSRITTATFECKQQSRKFLIQLNLGDVVIRQNGRTGEVEVFGSGTRYLRFVPQQVELTVRSKGIELSCRKGGIGHFQSGARRFYTSQSGIVVSDSKTVASVDNFGQFVCY